MALASSLCLLAAAAAAAAATGVHADPPPPLDHRLQTRATDRSPKGYAPTSVDCPAQRPTVRRGSAVSPQERQWLPRRRNETIPHIRDLLKRIAIPDFDSEAYLQNAERDAAALPNIGLAVSGGGYRAMLTGAGAVAAWDDRSDGSLNQGNLGGLLQSATYLSGLSGGGWLVGSLYTNNFTSVQDAVNSPNIWQFEDSILKGPEQYSLLQYYKDILDDVEDKEKAGFNTSITDYWGRMLSYQLINATDGGPGFTFSSIADDPDFSTAKTPLPFLVADSRAPGETLISSNSTIYVFSPWELGSADPSLQGYAPLRYVGSRFNNGSIPDTESCINGFDNAGYVMGTSSSLFNQIVLYLRDGNSKYVPKDVPGFIVEALTSLLNALGDGQNDIADWRPNPFKGFNEANNPAANNDRLTLVDGGEDSQNIPYYPHLHSDRAVDVVFSVDSSADTNHSWPDGASAQATYRRSLEDISRGSGFPPVPGVDSFLNLGLNTRPTFFGCNASNMSSPAPLIVYMANYPYLYHANISTFQLSMSAAERDAVIQNGWAVVTQLNSSRDADWPVCVGCAMLARSFDRTRTAVPQKCQDCFQKYCWDGRTDESTPPTYNPDYIGTPIKVDDHDSSASIRVAPSAATALFIAMVSMFFTFVL